MERALHRNYLAWEDGTPGPCSLAPANRAANVGDIIGSNRIALRLALGRARRTAARARLPPAAGQRAHPLRCGHRWLPSLRRGRRPLHGRSQAPARPHALPARNGLRAGADAPLPLRPHRRRHGASDPPQPTHRSARAASGQHLADALRRVDARRALLAQPHRARRGRSSAGLLAGAPDCRDRAALHGPIRHRAQPLHSRNGPGAGRRARNDSARQSVQSAKKTARPSPLRRQPCRRCCNASPDGRLRPRRHVDAPRRPRAQSHSADLRNGSPRSLGAGACGLPASRRKARVRSHHPHRADAHLLVSRPVALVRAARSRRAPCNPHNLRVPQTGCPIHRAGCPIHRARCDGWDDGCPIHRALCDGWDEKCPIDSALFAEWVGVIVSTFGPDRRRGQ